MLVVQKYGGTSVADIDRIRNVAKRVISYREKGDKVVVVLSAMAGETDRLLNLAHSIDRFPDERELDVLISTGEQVTSAMLAITLKSMLCDAVSMQGHQVRIITDSSYTKARIAAVEKNRLSAELDKGRVVVVSGFQGIDEKGDITTLGRGGSDTTAVALAAALQADVCEIYTDVDGVLTRLTRTFAIRQGVLIKSRMTKCSRWQVLGQRYCRYDRLSLRRNITFLSS